MMFAGALPTIRSEWQLDAASAGTVQTVFSLTNARRCWWLLGGVIRWGAPGLPAVFLAGRRCADAVRRVCPFLCRRAGVDGLRRPDAGRRLYAGTAAGDGDERPGPARLRHRHDAGGQFVGVFSVGFHRRLERHALGAGVAFSCVPPVRCWGAGGFVGPVGYREPQLRTLGRQTKRESYAITYATLLLLVGYIAHSWELLGNWARAPSPVSEALSGFSLIRSAPD